LLVVGRGKPKGDPEEEHMSIAFRDISALATARRSGTKLDSEKTKTPEKPAEKAEGPNVSTALEALRAVLPATLITFYSTAVILLQATTNAAGAGDRAAEQAALAQTFGAGTPALESALKALPAEPATFAVWRVVFAFIWVGFVAIYAFRTAQVDAEPGPGRPARRVFLEPIVATAAFIAWALASPGTFLAAYLNSTNLAIATILIAFVGAGGLCVVSEAVLKKKAADAD
jgi:hypothetical protein